MKGDLRLLIPALGIWSGALAQSLLFSAPSALKWIGTALLLVIGIFSRRPLVGVLLVAALLGAVILAMHQSALQRDFFTDRIGQVVNVKAVVSSDVRKLEGDIRGDFRRQDRFLIEAKSRELDDYAITVPLLIFGDQTLATLIPGQEISLLARVTLPRGYSTIAASLIQVGDITRRGAAPWIWQSTSSIRRAIKASLSGLPRDAQALIPGLVIGDRSAQDARLNDAMRRSGLTHLTAVSGANFAIVAALLLLIGRALGVRGPFLWGSIALFLLLFIFLVRPSSSVLRAAVMTGVLLFARARGVRASPIPALATAISLLLLINPFYVRDAGFALSVFATAGLLFLAPHIQERLEVRKVPSVLAEALAIPISATIFCLPIIVVLSRELSLISILANFLVAPVIAIITGAGLLLMIFAPINSGIGAVIGWFITPFAMWIAIVARALAALPFAALRWPGSWFGALTIIVLVLSVIWLIKRGKRVILWMVLAALFVQALFAVKPLSRSWIPNDWQIFQCDVGQGDALVLRTTLHRAVLVDVGPDTKAIDRCLRLLNIKELELVILTHFHADHVAGLSGVLKGRKVHQVWTSPTVQPADEAARVERLVAGIPTRSPRLGELFASAGLALRVIAVADYSNANDSSISIVANIDGITLFAAGDLELEGQARALRALRRLPPDRIWSGAGVDVMKGTHHGSAMQDPQLIEFLRPRLTVFSVGAENPYGHPTESALELYGRYGRIVRTDQRRSLALAMRAGNLIVVAQPDSPWAL